MHKLMLVLLEGVANRTQGHCGDLWSLEIFVAYHSCALYIQGGCDIELPSVAIKVLGAYPIKGWKVVGSSSFAFHCLAMQSVVADV